MSTIGSYVERGFRAILFVDMVESVRLIEFDEEGTIARWIAFTQYVENAVLHDFCGRLVKSLGDGMLLEFSDMQSAILAAFAIQSESARRNLGYEAQRQIHLRVGIEVSEIMFGPHDVYGKGVNIAARLSNLGAPGDIIVSAQAHDQLTPMLDADIEDLGECYLKHIEAPVRAYRINPPGIRPTVSLPAPYLQLCPSIAIIPFRCRQGAVRDPLGEILADELINALSRSKKIDVISRLSTTAFRGRAVSIENIAQHLGANYILFGVYDKEGQNVVLQLELSDPRSQRIVWSDRLNDTISDVLRGDQDLINRVAAQVYGAIVSQELRRTRTQPLSTLESHTLLMSAIALMHRRSERDFLIAKEMLQAIVDRSPRQSLPRAWLAKWYVLRIQQGMSNDRERDAAEAIQCTQQALQLDPESSLALAIDGLVHTHMTKRHDLAERSYRSAIESNPNNALAWLLKGTQHAFTGDGNQAVLDTQRALRLSPLDPHSYYFHSLGASAYITAGEYELALSHAELSIRSNRLHTSTLRVKAVAQWRVGLCDQARQTAAELLRLEPDLTVTRWLRRSPSEPYEVGKAFAKTLVDVGIPK